MTKRRVRKTARTPPPSLKRALWAVGITIGVALAPGAWRWVERDARDWAPNETRKGEEGPSISARGVERFEARDAQGRPAWQFAARRIDLSSDKRWATLEAVQRAILFREGKPFFTMSASNVRFDQETRDWQAQDDLRVQGPDGLDIRSVSATWNEKEQRLDCPDAVSAHFRGADITTVGLSYDARKGELQSLDPVSLSAPHISARGSRAVVDVKNQIVVFPEGVSYMRIEPPLLEKYGLKR